MSSIFFIMSNTAMKTVYINLCATDQLSPQDKFLDVRVLSQRVYIYICLNIWSISWGLHPGNCIHKQGIHVKLLYTLTNIGYLILYLFLSNRQDVITF